MAPFDESDPVQVANAIVDELKSFSPALAERERWLVLNKLDLLPEDQQKEVCDRVVSELEWEGPVYQVSAISSQGTEKLAQDLMTYIEERNLQESEDAEMAAQETEVRQKLERRSSWPHA